jgi:hypothetical protein
MFGSSLISRKNKGTIWCQNEPTTNVDIQLLPPLSAVAHGRILSMISVLPPKPHYSMNIGQYFRMMTHPLPLISNPKFHFVIFGQGM